VKCVTCGVEMNENDNMCDNDTTPLCPDCYDTLKNDNDDEYIFIGDVK